MYILYYLNRNYQIGTIAVANLNFPILIPEDLIFCNLRKGINFIKEPSQCCDFTDVERLIMASEFTDMELVKQADFRRANTYLNVLCQVDLDYPYYDPNLPVPYIVFYDSEKNKLHFNMTMPATGIYDLETTYDNGVTWNRVLYYTAHNETIEVPGYPGYYIEDKLLGSSELPMCNNSMNFSYETADQKLRVSQNGVVLSQPMF